MLFDPDKLIAPSKLSSIETCEYDDLPVTEARSKILKAGDGLSEALRMAPVHVPIGSHVVIVLVAEATSHQHSKIKAGRGQNAVELDEYVETTAFSVEGATFVDPDLVSEVVTTHMLRVEEERARAEEAKRQAQGIVSLFDEDDDRDDDD